ncbi:MAG TPA: YdeI/OmpD-associated family protein [Candidatus Saccharimonadales bacterium]|nr:YdeI/OmpD-associated family protein [Candidatus Saccharimonadales bacterium]
MSAIRFRTKLFKIGEWTIIRLPEDASAKLPSRGQTMVKGTINGYAFQSVLEPDGKWSHWFRADESLQKQIGAKAGDTVVLDIESTKEWPEPDLPQDLKLALQSHPQASAMWKAITPMARWDWIRWIRGTKDPETRKRRIEASMSKMKAGERRPCCFNRAMCTDPYVSKSGVLLMPIETR